MSLTIRTRSGDQVTVGGPFDDGGRRGMVFISASQPRAMLTPAEARHVGRKLAHFAGVAAGPLAGPTEEQREGMRRLEYALLAKASLGIVARLDGGELAEGEALAELRRRVGEYRAHMVEMDEGRYPDGT
jgi:hypothetical protein